MHQPKTFSNIAEQFAALSERQQQVVTLVCDALSNKMIAQKLDTSETAIKACLHATYGKLGVRSRYELGFVLANRGKPKPDTVACFRLMRTYKELGDLATSCANSARLTTSPEVASQLWRMAMDYQEKAAKLNDGKLPNIGDPPIVIVTRV